MRRALITGITGQDGSYLAELLLAKGYEVWGMVRRQSTTPRPRLEHLHWEDREAGGTRLHLEYGDLADGSSLRRVLSKVRPQEVYNLAAQSHVRVSFDQPEYTADVVALGTLRLLEALREHCESTGEAVRFYQASSSEMFGASPPPQNESTPFQPRSPYAVAKLAAYWQTVNYREAYGIHASNGILFNHESERRTENFVTRKITRAAGRIRAGIVEKLWLGNLDAQRDWGHAEDYVEAMWLMLQQDEPDDYVVATGVMHSVRDVLDRAFGRLDLDWREHVEIDPYYLRATEVNALRGDATKARERLGWEPRVDFDTLIARMVDHDYELAQREAHARDFVAS